MRDFNSVRMILATAVLTVGAVCGASGATFTTINTVGANPILASFLDGVYGAGNYERVADDLDAIWSSEDLIGATALGKFANAKQQLGVCVLCDGSDNFLIGPAVTQNGLLSLLLFEDTYVFGGPSFRWFNAAWGDPYVGTAYSDPSLNPGSVDQMVTFAIKDRPGVFVLAFEDRLSGFRFAASDRDFNDFIVEVRFAVPQTVLPPPPPTGLPPQPLTPTIETIATVPEPTGIALLGGALLALAFGSRARRRSL